MARRRRGPMTLPPWIIGPGLLVPPVFIPLFLCAMPTPVPPSIPIPSIDVDAADRHLQARAEKLAKLELTRREEVLMESWKELQQAELRGGGETRAAKKRLASAQKQYRSACRRVWRDEGTERLLDLGDSIALSLTEAIVNLSVRPTKSIPAATAIGGGFLWRAHASGLLSPEGRLTMHPIVPFALAQIAFRSSCGLRNELDMDPLELDGIDIHHIVYGSKLPLSVRLSSLDRYSKRHTAYQAGRARAVILLKVGKATEAFEALKRDAIVEPKSLAVRNHLLYAQAVGG